MKKTFTLIITIILIAVCLCGCGAKKATLSIDGKDIPVDTLYTIDGEKIPLAEFRYYFLSIKAEYDYGLDSYWTDYPEDYELFFQDVLDAIRYKHAIVAYTKQNNLKLTSTEKQEMKEYINYVKTQYGTDYETYLAANNMTIDVFEKMVEEDAYVSVIQDYLFGLNGTKTVKDAEVLTFMRENYIRYKMIYIKLDYDDTKTNYNLACDIIERLKKNEKFDGLMNLYTRDTYASENSNGYYYPIATASKFLDALEALEINGFSEEVFVDDSGYYIFKRLDMEDSNIIADIETYRSVMENNIIAEEIQDIIDNQKIVIVSEYYDKINFETLK